MNVSKNKNSYVLFFFHIQQIFWYVYMCRENIFRLRWWCRWQHREIKQGQKICMSNKLNIQNCAQIFNRVAFGLVFIGEWAPARGVALFRLFFMDGRAYANGFSKQLESYRHMPGWQSKAKVGWLWNERKRQKILKIYLKPNAKKLGPRTKWTRTRTRPRTGARTRPRTGAIGKIRKCCERKCVT